MASNWLQHVVVFFEAQTYCSHAKVLSELSMPQLVWENTHRHNRAAVTPGHEHDWLMGRWSHSSPPPWLAFSFHKTLWLWASASNKATWRHLWGLSQKWGGKPPTWALSGTNEPFYTSRCIWQWLTSRKLSKCCFINWNTPPDVFSSPVLVHACGCRSCRYKVECEYLWSMG